MLINAATCFWEEVEPGCSRETHFSVLWSNSKACRNEEESKRDSWNWNINCNNFWQFFRAVPFAFIFWACTWGGGTCLHITFSCSKTENSIQVSNHQIYVQTADYWYYKINLFQSFPTEAVPFCINNILTRVGMQTWLVLHGGNMAIELQCLCIFFLPSILLILWSYGTNTP